MKKTVVYLLITALLFSLTGCIGLSKKHGFGELIILGDNLTREADPEQDETEPQPVDAEDVTVTIGSDTKKLGEKFVLRAGTYNAKIKAGSYAGELKVTVVVNKTTTLKPKLTLAKLQFNAWKFIFDPAKYEVTVEEQVHLVGEMNGWDPANLDYSLIKKSDGIWSAVFDVEEGQQFKFMYDSTDWGDGNDIGDDIGDDGGNITIGTNEEVVAPVLAWKFIFDPAKYEVTVDEQVHLVGEMNDWNPANMDYPLTKQEDGTWTALFDVEEGQQFKFMYDSTDWGDGNDIGDDIGDDGGNITIGTNEEVVTLDF